MPRIVDTFVVIDLDRTLLVSDALTELLYSQLTRYGVTMAQINEDFSYVKRHAGKSFSQGNYLRSKYGDDLYRQAVIETENQIVSGESAETLLYDGAIQLLRELDHHEIPYTILTYGEKENQELKLRLLRLLLAEQNTTLHAVVTSEPEKAKWIETTWQHTEQGFSVPSTIYKAETLVARSVVIIDDKPANLTSDSSEIIGILVDNTAQEGSKGLLLTAIAEYVAKGGSLSDFSPRLS